MEHSFQKIWSSKEGKERLLDLYQQYYADLYAYGLRICNNQEMTRDAIHDLFIQVWEGKINLSSVQSTKPYLLKSLRYILIDALKIKGKISNLSTEEVYEYVLSEEDVVIDAELSQENKIKLKEAILKLPAKQKEVIYLRYYEGLDYSEIAEVTETKNQSVRNTMSKALAELRKYFSFLYVIVNSIQFF